MKNSINFKYKIGYFQDKDGILLPKFMNKNETIAHVKRYNNHRHLLAMMESSCILLLDCLIEDMDVSDNSIENTRRKRKKYMDFLRKNCNTSYQDSTIKKAYKRLVDAGLLLQFSGRGYYVVNPRYYFKGDEKSRVTLLKSLCTYAYSITGVKARKLRKSLGV